MTDLVEPAKILHRVLTVLLAPFAGGILISIYLTVSQLDVLQTMENPCSEVALHLIICFIIYSFVNFFFQLPLLFFALWLGLRYTIGFMLLASIAVAPYASYISDPINAWHPTDEELSHGFYWDSFLAYVLLASATGWVFSRFVRQEPTQPSVARHTPRYDY